MEIVEPFVGNPQSYFPYEQQVANSPGVSWPAVFGGAFVTAALSVVLLALGTGLGLSSISPWSNVGASASTVGSAAIIWLIVMQIVASAIGGYLAGRLRTKWCSIHTNEVCFRDTAHGFMVWAVALVITAAFLTSATATMVGGAGPMANAAQADGQGFSPEAYFVDSLFRSGSPATDQADASLRAEVGRIFVHALQQKEFPAADKAYLTLLVSAKAGLPQADAEKRISDVFSDAQKVAEAARHSVTHLLLWLFIALLIGAFSASYAATIGGMQRDAVEAVPTSK